MEKWTNPFLKFIKKHWGFIVLFLTGLSSALILNRFIWCNFVTVKNVNQCTVLGQSAWEWIKLFIGPVIVALTGISLNRIFKLRDDNNLKQDKKLEKDRLRQQEELEKDRLRQDSLLKYFDQMTQLLLSENWPMQHKIPEKTGNISIDLPIIALAKARTFAVLNELDGKRKGSLLLFLHETESLKFISLRKSNLREAFLNETILSGINLSEADLRAAKLSGADLNGAILNKATLSGADLRAAHLRGAELTKVFLNKARIERADLREAKLIGALMINAKIGRANLRKANLNGAFLSEADLIGTDLREAKLNMADLSGAKLSGADLSGADLSDANLNGTQLMAAKPRQEDLKVSHTLGMGLIAPYLSDPKGMSIDQIKSANNWEKAHYSDPFRKKLGLPPTPSPDQTQEESE